MKVLERKTIDLNSSIQYFEASWESLKRYQVPKWYEDAKFGIFIHWGVYSVPAFGSEWYPRFMYQKGTPEYEHHLKTYGDHKKFGYKNFISDFTAEKFDAEKWSDLFRRSGARFVMPVAEHHDGFAMYDSSFTRWKATNMGPCRDVLAELKVAVESAGMVFSLSSHRAENWFYYDGGKTFDSDVIDPDFSDFYGPAQKSPPNDVNGHIGRDPYSEPSPDSEFLQGWLDRTCELVDKYQPQIVWFDWWILHKSFEPYLQQFAAHYYNRAIGWGKEVAINYKYSAFEEGSAVYDIERGQFDGIRPMLWQNDTSVSKNSWGYVHNHDYKSVTSLVGDLIDVVSKNGALLLNIGPKPDGTIPQREVEILEEIGGWLKLNGEGIYETRPWVTYGEGPTQIVEGDFSDTKRNEFTSKDIRFTCKDNVIYAFVLNWPESTVLIKSLAPTSLTAEIESISLLGSDEKINWTLTREGPLITFPRVRPCKHAYTLKIKLVVE